MAGSRVRALHVPSDPSMWALRIDLHFRFMTSPIVDYILDVKTKYFHQKYSSIKISDRTLGPFNIQWFGVLAVKVCTVVATNLYYMSVVVAIVLNHELISHIYIFCGSLLTPNTPALPTLQIAQGTQQPFLVLSSLPLVVVWFWGMEWW